jgi:hypothetical protein
MATVAPFHASFQGEERLVYHTNTRCERGNVITQARRVPGNGGFRHCLKCVMFDADDWVIQAMEKSTN